MVCLCATALHKAKKRKPPAFYAGGYIRISGNSKLIAVVDIDTDDHYHESDEQLIDRPG